MRTARKKKEKTMARITAWQEKFDAALGDDLNTPQALAIIFDLVKTPTSRSRKNGCCSTGLIRYLGLISHDKAEEIPPRKPEKLEKYKECRTSKQFVQSDALRKEIEALGYEVRDTEKGSRLVKKFF